MEFLDYPDTDMLMLRLAQTLASDLRAALARRERVLFAVPGGTTPGPVFDLLGGLDLEWERVDIVPGDERWVPEEDPRSNAGQIRSRLIRGKARAARLIPLWRPLPAPADAVAEVSESLAGLLPVDVALVGMGGDMHTASLFPGAEALAQALTPDAPPVVAIAAPGAPEPRITLSARILRDAFALHVLITGDAKRAALEKAQGMAPIDAPIAALLPQASVHWAP